MSVDLVLLQVVQLSILYVKPFVSDPTCFRIVIGLIVIYTLTILDLRFTRFGCIQLYWGMGGRAVLPLGPGTPNGGCIQARVRWGTNLRMGSR